MAERFKILQSLESTQFSTENSSIQIIAARILADAQDGKRYLQVKFINNSNQAISNLDVTVRSGNMRIAIQHYTDLNLKSGDSTGSKTLISIPDIEDYRALSISISIPSLNSIPVTSPQSSSNFSAGFGIAKKPTVPQIVLLISVVLLISSLALSLCDLFVSNVFYVDDPTWYSANLYKIATELSNSSYTRASYPIPFSIYFGVYGYALSAILAVLFCLFLAEKKRSTPVLRVVPFLPFGFQLFLISILYNRSFVDIYDEDNCSFVLRRCSFENTIYPWLICAGAACLSYIVFLFLTRQRTKNDGAKRNRKKALIVLVEVISVMIVPLIGSDLASNYETKLINTCISASLTVTNNARSNIAARYGLDEITYSDVLESALTKTSQSNIEQFIEKYDMIDSSTDKIIGTLYCIGIIDTNDSSNTYFRVFWKITDPSIQEVSTSDNAVSEAPATDIPDDLSEPHATSNSTSSSSADWKKAYCNYISSSANYCLDDLDGNGIPELFEFFDGCIQICWYDPGEGVGGDDICYTYYDGDDSAYYVKGLTSSVILTWTSDGYSIDQFADNRLSNILLAYESTDSSGNPVYILYQNFEEHAVSEDEYYSAQDAYMVSLTGFSNWWDMKNEAYGAYSAPEIKSQINAY